MFLFWSKRTNRAIRSPWPCEPIQVGTVTLDPVLVLLALAGLAVLALIALAIALIVHMGRRRRQTEAQAGELAELKGRLQSFAEISVARQGDIARAVNERLDRMTHRVGTDLNETSRKTHESIAKLNERLAVIDTAQKNLTDLSTNMVSLQEILANKQARGAFGQMRMETIVKDGLPKGAYTFQATLSNGKRPDCLLHMPNSAASVVIDAKFPLEGFEAFRVARRDEDKKEAARRVRVDVGRHVDAMAERYFIAGETQDTAILFVPSEAIYADLAEHFSDLVQKAHRARIVICAPNMLMLAVQTMQAILKDVQMREQAHLIQGEVAKLMDDMNRFRERVLDLQRHFGQANDDIDKILTSSEKIASRGQQDRDLGFRGAAGACGDRAAERRGSGPLTPALSPTGRGSGAAAERRLPPARSARQRFMTTPLPLWHGIVLEQMLVGAAASLVNLIIHAVLLGVVVWTVRGLAERDSFVPGFVQYTIVIVLTGTLLMAGHFVEVMVWAITYGLVGVAPARVELIYLAFGNYTTLGYADLVAPEQWRLLRPMTALNGIMLIGWSTALIIEILRRSGTATQSPAG